MRKLWIRHIDASLRGRLTSLPLPVRKPLSGKALEMQDPEGILTPNPALRACLRRRG